MRSKPIVENGTMHSNFSSYFHEENGDICVEADAVGLRVGMSTKAVLRFQSALPIVLCFAFDVFINTL